MGSGLEVMIFMGLILKIPVIAACWLLWHAIRATPDVAEAEAEDGGGGQPHKYFRRGPKRPRDPRRGPHAPDALPLPCPEDEGSLRVLRRPAHGPLPAPAAHERR